MRITFVFHGGMKRAATPLGCRKEDLAKLTLDELAQAILERRNLAREHRGQVGHDRCQRDDYLIECWLDDTPLESTHLTSAADEMERCRLFHANRQKSGDSPVLTEFTEVDCFLADAEVRRWLDWGDECTQNLIDELLRLQQVALAFRGANPRTWEHDEVVYMALPEKRPANTQLPDDFLTGNSTDPRAGCRPWIDSHLSPACQSAARCNLHDWGPCATQA